VQLDTSGADHLAGSELWARDEVVITSIGGISPRPIAGYVRGMVLAFAYRLPQLLGGQAAREWPSPAERWARYVPRSLHGSRMVIVGYGRIGRGVARAAAGFGVEVVGVRRGAMRDGLRMGDDEPDVALATVGPERLLEALAEADLVVVCVPGTPETRGLIGARELAAVRSGAFLVNVSRGGVVDEAALCAALDEGRLAGAAADVFSQEPLPPDSPLWRQPGLIVTPHVAGFAPNYREAVRDLFHANLARFCAGEPLVNVIDRRLGY
jgi:phosphoglycerate dehydrogenase-like enzyme